MLLKEDSLAAVLVGDWSKSFIQPDWIAENVYEKHEIEIGVNGQGVDFTVSYRCDNIIISPEQDRVMFSAANIDNITVDTLCRCLNNFIEKAYTPSMIAYGLNSDFEEEDGSIFAEILDGMGDANTIIENGYEIVDTQISRILKGSNGKIINMNSGLENGRLKVHFNEHHEGGESRPVFDAESINGFIQECCRIMESLGYELEGEEL